MQSQMHGQSNQSERPAEQDSYKLIRDGLGPIHLGADRTENIYSEDISFNQGFLHSVDFSNSQFSIYMNFQQCNGTKAKFMNCELPFARFQNSVLNGAKFDGAYLARSNFEGAKLGAINQVKPLFLPIANDTSSRFQRLFPLLTPRLTQPHAIAATFVKANLTRASLKSAELEGCDFREANLTEAIVEDANLSNADLRGAKITSVQLEKARSLTGTKVDLVRCIEDELQSEKPRVVKLIMKLAELSATRGLDLELGGGVKNPELDKTLVHVFRAKAEGKITQKQLEKDFRTYYRKLERQNRYQDMPPEKYLPSIFEKIQFNLAHPEIDSESSGAEEPEVQFNRQNLGLSAGHKSVISSQNRVAPEQSNQDTNYQSGA